MDPSTESEIVKKCQNLLYYKYTQQQKKRNLCLTSVFNTKKNYTINNMHIDLKLVQIPV